MPSMEYKRILSFLMAIAMVLSMSPVHAHATEWEVYDNEQEAVVIAESGDTVVAVDPVAEEAPADAAPETRSAAYTELQSTIDNMLSWYLGTTQMETEAVYATVNALVEDMYWNALIEVEDLENSELLTQLTEDEQTALVENNVVFGDFATAVYDRWNSSPADGSLYTTINVLNGTVSLTDNQNTIKNNSGTVTATAKGGMLSKKTNTITITNISANTATLAFDYTVTSSSSFTIDGASADTSGRYSNILAPNASVKFAITSNSGFSNLTVTLTINNITLTEAKTSSNVTFEYDSTLGSVTAAGSAVASGATKEGVSLTEGVALVATPVSGAKFLGWTNAADDTIFSTDANYKFVPTDDVTVKAVFAPTTGSPYFMVGTMSAHTYKTTFMVVITATEYTYYTVSGTHLFDNLEDATATAESTSSKGIVLMNNGTLPAGNHTIPSGVTLLIPFDDANTLYTTGAASVSSRTVPTAYRTLTMADGANLVINGAMSISAKHKYAAGSGVDGGAPTGPCSFVNMQNGSSITVNGALYAYGYITGSGAVTVNSSAKVYEMFQIADFRGGSQSTDMDNGVFPLSQYYVQNVEVPMKVYSGAKVYCYTTIYMSSTDFGTAVEFVGEKGLFNMTSGYLVKDYIEDKDRLSIELYGDGALGSIALEVGTTSIDSSSYDLAINSNITLDFKAGSDVTLNQDICLLPGIEFIVREGATCTLGSKNNVYVYDADQWGKYCFSKENKKYAAVIYAPGRNYTRTEADLVDAAVLVNGTVDASAGYVYTTAGGANIYSTGAGKVITTAGTQTVTHQLVQGTGYTEIPLTPAKLKNANGISPDFTSTASGTYTYSDGRWTCETDKHSGEWTVTKDATCKETGSQERTCTICGKFETQTIPTAAHDEVIDKAVAPTCTETGLTEGSHCDVCGEVIVPQEVVPSNGHSPSDTWKPATYEQPKRLCCGNCGEVLEEKNSVKVGDVEYLTLREALDGNPDKNLPAVSSRGTITLLTNITYAQGDAPISQIVVINKNGFTIDLAPGEWTEKNDAGEVVATHTYDVYSPEGEDKVVVKQEPFSIAATNIAANDSLDLNFYIWEYDLEGNEDYYAVITKTFADERPNVVETHKYASDWTESSKYFGRKIKFQDISAKEMMDNVQIVIYDANGKQVSTVFNETIEKYAIRTLARKDTLANNELTTALVDMLNYGAAAQDYFDYNNKDSTQKANVRVGELQNCATKDSVVDDTDTYFDQRIAGEYLTTTTVSARNQIMLTFYFDEQYVNPTTQNLKANVSYGSTFSKEISGADFYYNRRYKWYGVDVTGIPIADGNQLVTCVIMDGDNVISTSKDSITGFCVRNKSESDDVYRDMLKFVDSAYKYFCTQ